MHTTVDLIDAAKAARGIATDYRLAKILGLTTAAVSAMRVRGGGISDETAEKLADLAGLDAGYVLACAHAERAKSASLKSIWESVAKKAAGAAVAVLIGAGLLPYADTPTAGERAGGVGGMYIMSNNIRTHADTTLL
mgnify:CR=1 FL=1